MFPQYTNFVKPLRLIPRRASQADRMSQADVDFDNWDEMDKLFSESDLVFSDEKEEVFDPDAPEVIKIDRTSHFSTFCFCLETTE